jgi:hypothetical protein
LAERISYEQLYQDAVCDPTLKRTKQELEVALENARLARDVVFELFQDIETFNVEDYRQFDDGGVGMSRLLAFIRDGVQANGASLQQQSESVYEVTVPRDGSHVFTTSRELAKERDKLELLGLEHPLVRRLLAGSRELPARDRALMGRSGRSSREPSILSVWRIEIHGAGGFFRQAIVPLAVNSEGHRLPNGEALLTGLREIQPAPEGVLDTARRRHLVSAVLPQMLRRDVEHRGLLSEGSSLAMWLVAWVELS